MAYAFNTEDGYDYEDRAQDMDQFLADWGDELRRIA